MGNQPSHAAAASGPASPATIAVPIPTSTVNEAANETAPAAPVEPAQGSPLFNADPFLRIQQVASLVFFPMPEDPVDTQSRYANLWDAWSQLEWKEEDDLLKGTRTSELSTVLQSTAV